MGSNFAIDVQYILIHNIWRRHLHTTTFSLLKELAPQINLCYEETIVNGSL